MAKLTQTEIEEIRRTHNIRAEDIGKQRVYVPPRRKGYKVPEWVYALVK